MRLVALVVVCGMIAGPDGAALRRFQSAQRTTVFLMLLPVDPRHVGAAPHRHWKKKKRNTATRVTLGATVSRRRPAGERRSLRPPLVSPCSPSTQPLKELAWMPRRSAIR
ncbi:hypothetical protein EYF80_044473 [Liparis tanakae]|uniref:Secreted protein n=1 Tax=Liparis tanakae TaxID=230148 RepID=A0A4Z2FYC5_9TELE|nr:hypothetical protein EYF80_044473 [Liparis tanakae]